MGYEIKPEREREHTHGLPSSDRPTRDLLLEMRRSLLLQAEAIERYLNMRPAVEHCPYCHRVFGGRGHDNTLHLEKFERAVKRTSAGLLEEEEEEQSDGG